MILIGKLEFSQLNDWEESDGNSYPYESIELEINDGGAGGYIILKTKEFTIDKDNWHEFKQTIEGILGSETK